MDDQSDRAILLAYSTGRMTAMEARRRLGSVGFGDLLRRLADAGLALPTAPTAGREERLARARERLFPKPARHVIGLDD